MDQDLDTSKIKNWRSITTLIVFVITNIIVLFPFNVPIYVPRWLCNATLDSLSALRIIPARKHSPQHLNKPRLFVRLKIPFNFVTAPLTAVFFLLAILAIGRQEVKDGTIGYLQISPIDIMAFFLTLAYIAISIDASGLIRWLAFKVLQKAGTVGHRLFFYLYAFFFALGSFLGNDPLILSGTAFLAYMTRVSSNIVHPRAWIHSQFAIANICSAILVSSNPTNLVLAGAFNIRFITYTANMIVPVVATAVVMFPFLLYIIFADESLIPLSIQMHELSDEAKARPPVNPNIPNARGTAEEQEEMDNENGQLLSLEEIMNPFLDKGGAAFGAVLMAATLITILSVNASSQTGHSKPVFYVTLPAAFIMFCWDLASGWINRKDTREIAARGRRAVEDAKAERERKESNRKLQEQADTSGVCQERLDQSSHSGSVDGGSGGRQSSNGSRALHDDPEKRQSVLEYSKDVPFPKIRCPIAVLDNSHQATIRASPEPLDESPTFVVDEEKRADLDLDETNQPKTLLSISKDLYRWLQETFPTVTVVLSHLPFPLVPFALAMFVLVQALVTKGWVPVFAYGWDHWVNRTGTVGAIGGMGFLSVILCNFAGTNIGTTILLCRVIQAWQTIHKHNNIPISDRTFWATVYSMALGVNYGAFSTAFSASLAGLLWRDILRRKHIRVGSIEFARVNLPIIAISMAVGCIVLVGQVYIMRKTTPYE